MCQGQNHSTSGPSSTTRVCVYVGIQSPSEGLIILQAPYTSQPDSIEHRGIHLSPTLTPLGFTSTPL